MRRGTWDSTDINKWRVIHVEQQSDDDPAALICANNEQGIIRRHINRFFAMNNNPYSKKIRCIYTAISTLLLFYTWQYSHHKNPGRKQDGNITAHSGEL